MPLYEGRRLARPDDEIVDQGLGFDIATLVGRRQLLHALGVGAALVGLTASKDDPAPATSATSNATTASGEIPDETAGPYPGDGSNGPDVLSDSGIVRSDIRSSFGGASATAEGVPMTLELTITNLTKNSAPFAGAAVDVWHCDGEGRYSMYSPGVTDQNYLRGVQIADASGKVTYATIFPACYSGRWPHIHFEVYPAQSDITDASNAIAASQVALPKDICDTVYAEPRYNASVANLARVSLADDNVFGDTDGVSQLGTVTGDVASGYTVSLTAAIDTTTRPFDAHWTGCCAWPSSCCRTLPPPRTSSKRARLHRHHDLAGLPGRAVPTRECGHFYIETPAILRRSARTRTTLCYRIEDLAQSA